MHTHDFVALENEANASLGEQFFVNTYSGPKSLSFAVPHNNSYQKKLLHLWKFMKFQHQRRVLVDLVLKLEPTRVSKLHEVLESLSDGQLVVLAAALDFAPVPQFEKFLDILSASFQPLKIQKPRQIDGQFKEVSIPAVLRPSPSLFGGFQQKVLSTPSEIREIIMDYYLEKALAPKFLFPDQRPNVHGHHSFLGQICHEPEP